MPRKTITIAEVSEPRERQGKNGPYHILDVKDGEGRKYSCLKSSLFDHFKVGASLDCDVKEEQREYDGNQFTSRTIMDVFVEGQAVAAQRQGGGRSYGKSPEERGSIEKQVAVKEVGEALRMGLPVIPEIQGAYWRIVSGWLNAPQSAQDGQGVASASNPIPTGIPQPRTSRDDADEPDRNFEGTVGFDGYNAVPQGKGARTFDTTLAFLKAAVNELGLTQTQILTALGIEKGADLFGHDLSVEWQKLVRAQKGEGNG